MLQYPKIVWLAVATIVLMGLMAIGIRDRMSYDPFPNGTKIMPLGDSITDGYNILGGYRTELWRLLVDGGYEINFVGSLASGPPNLPDKDHEGHSGWQIAQIHKRLEGWLRRAQPEVLLLLIGSNDIGRDDEVETAPDRLDALIADIFKQQPNVTLFVGSIPPIDAPPVNQRVINYNSAIATLIANRSNAGESIFFVDIYSALTVRDLEDGLHPNLDGHQKIARTWYEAIAPVLTVPVPPQS